MKWYTIHRGWTMHNQTQAAGWVAVIDNVIVATSPNFEKFLTGKARVLVRWARNHGFAVYSSNDPNKKGSRI